MTRAQETRLLAKTVCDAETQCWNWVGAKRRGGYGAFWSDGAKMVSAHRAAYELLVGPIPSGLVIDHLCRNPACINPEHMEPVTKRENERRGMLGVLKTHCKRGHELTHSNTWIRRNGWRQCRTCHMLDERARRKRKKLVS